MLWNLDLRSGYLVQLEKFQYFGRDALFFNVVMLCLFLGYTSFKLFFWGTFHNIFKLGTPYLFLQRYQWKKLPKPPWGGFGKNHCREYLIGYNISQIWLKIDHLLLMLGWNTVLITPFYLTLQKWAPPLPSCVTLSMNAPFSPELN